MRMRRHIRWHSSQPLLCTTRVGLPLPFASTRPSVACGFSFSVLFVGQVDGLQMNLQDAEMIRSDESCARPTGDAANGDTSDRVCRLLACCMSACSITAGPLRLAICVDLARVPPWGPGPDVRLTRPWTASKSKCARTAALSG
jgi:hypothetical protein